jgi:hypothetical protein
MAEQSNVRQDHSPPKQCSLSGHIRLDLADKRGAQRLHDAIDNLLRLDLSATVVDGGVVNLAWFVAQVSLVSEKRHTLLMAPPRRQFHDPITRASIESLMVWRWQKFKNPSIVLPKERLLAPRHLAAILDDIANSIPMVAHGFLFRVRKPQWRTHSERRQHQS